MVDLGGNFNGYMGDMSRVFSVGKLSDEAYTAHQVCLDIQEAVSSMAQPGVVCEDLYNAAINIVTKAGFADKFMGISQQAKFIGHGIGSNQRGPCTCSPYETRIGTGNGFRSRTENRHSGCRSRRYRKLLGSNSRRC